MRALGLGLLLVCFGIVGCGPDIRAECEANVQCKGGNDKDIEACVAVQDDLRDYLADIGCEDEYDAQFECTEPLKKCQTVPTARPCTMDADCFSGETCSGTECVDKSYSIEADDRDKCEAETAAYQACARVF